MMGTWKIILSSVSISTVACSLLMWFFREWISARLKKSIQHEYDVKLEGYKAGYTRFLTENEIRFSRWHEEKLEAIKEVYGNLAAVHYYLTFLLSLESDPRWKIDQEQKSQTRKAVTDRYAAALEPCLQSWLNNRLFIEDEEDKIIAEIILKTDRVLSLYKYCMTNNDVSILQSNGAEILKELDMIMNTLRHRVQDILQGKTAEQIERSKQ